MKQSGCREIPSWPNSQPNTPRRSTAAAVTTAPSANDTTCSVPISPLIHGGVTQVAPGSTHRRPHTDHLHSRRESFHVKHGSSPTTGTPCHNRGRVMVATDAGDTHHHESTPHLACVQRAKEPCALGALKTCYPSRFRVGLSLHSCSHRRHQFADRHCVAHRHLRN